MMFFFYPDGTGAWGYAEDANSAEVYTFHYAISGDVNVSWKEDISKEKGSGYFTTLANVGQCFVSEGVTFNRRK